MKKINVVIAIVLVAIPMVAVLLIIGHSVDTDRGRFDQTFFPTNHYVVVGHGTNGEVVVETTSTNLLPYLRVHVATLVGLLTNGQPVRVQLTLRPKPYNGGVELISSKAYPAVE